ncbi:MAG: BatA domain-containing protein [Bacteroidales bacterium]|nr:BatA domain-containing protein [Bacteroidales bacterium]
MNFLYPTFLFALFAVLIPIIIHLFNFRTYKTVFFSNVQFLKDIKQETKSKSTLKHLLVLLMRILAIISLVFAFAQPYIPSGSQQKSAQINEIGIYIDNSFSTEAESKYGKISEIAKKKALQIADAYPENTNFYFITNDFEQKHQHFVSKEQVKEFIQDIKISPAVKTISNITNKISDFFNADFEENIKRAYIISDFQKTSTDINKLQNDSNINYVFIPLETENTNNLFIDSVWFNSPSRPLFQTDEINIKITNKSDEAFQEMPLNLFLNDTLKATGSYNIEPNESITKTLSFTNNKTGIINGRVEITDFPVTYDNNFFFNFNIEKQIDILIISNKTRNKYIEDVFSDIPEVKIIYKTEKTTDFEKLNNYDVVINDEINKLSPNLIQATYMYISDGGTCIIFPGINSDIQSYNELFNKLNLNYITGIDTSKIYAGRINYNADIFRNVFKKKEKNLDLPYILRRVKFSKQTFTDEETILFSEKNDKLISSSEYGAGKVYVFSQTADKKAGNLVFHPIWAPMIYNMAFYKNTSNKIYYTIGKDEVVKFNNQLENKEQALHIINKKRTFDIIPQVFITDNSKIKLFLNNSIQKAGHYTVSSDNKDIKGLSFNYNRAESDLAYYTSSEIKNAINENSLSSFSVTDENEELFSEIIKEQSIGKQLWKMFLIFALFFLLAEILIIRLLK